MSNYKSGYLIVKETDYPGEGIHSFVTAGVNGDDTLYPIWHCYDSFEEAKKKLPVDCPGDYYFHIVKIMPEVPDSERNWDINEHDIEWDPEKAQQLKAGIYKDRFLEEVVPKLEGRDIQTIENHLRSGGNLSMRG